AGRPSPRVVVGVPVSATAEPDRVRAAAARDYAGYARLPSYEGVLEREGLSSPGGLVVAGDENVIAAGIARYADAGATDLLVSPLGDAAERARIVAVRGRIATS
ncbi:LLM class F420-dependent oxidoreductase, partial [Pseudonocardia sp. SID8383]|nr:LLM class F420-dependent oxidoreductase [Pseudonocardia sp. SID8383]